MLLGLYGAFRAFFVPGFFQTVLKELAQKCFFFDVFSREKFGCGFMHVTILNY